MFVAFTQYHIFYIRGVYSHLRSLYCFLPIFCAGKRLPVEEDERRRFKGYGGFAPDVYSAAQDPANSVRATLLVEAIRFGTC